MTASRQEETSVAKKLGPGLITGAADDDPSGIATYSQAGAQFGYGLMWTMVLTYPLMTAVGPLSYLWHGPLPYLPESEEWQAALIPALRAHQVHYVDLAQLRGLVSAPSFHTVAAVLYIRAAWPHRELRAPLVAVNAAMLLSTPVEGTHYLIDMILGAVVAVVAIVAVRWLMAVKAGPRLAAA